MFRPYEGHHQAIQTMVLVMVQVLLLPPTGSRGLQFIAHIKIYIKMHYMIKMT